MSDRALIAATSAFVALACAIPQPVFGQSDANPRLEEIVVTAKQREENLQDVPLSITVFTAAALENRGIGDVRDLAQFTPNFNIYSGDGRQNASGTNVRGLAPNTSDERYQPVSYFIDGVAVGGITTGLSVIDVERTEIIKGPQSATFGRATYAGAIDFVTTTPSLTEFSGRVRAQFSEHGDAEGANHDVSGYIGGPIVQDVLSGSLFLQQKTRGGFAQAPGAQFSEVGEEETFAGSAVLFAALGDSTTLKTRIIYTEEEDQEAMYHTTQPLYWQQEGANIVTLSNGALWVDGDVPDPIRRGVRGVDLSQASIDGQSSATDAPLDGGYARERLFFSAILEHDFDNGLSLSYRGSYGKNEYDGFVDFRGRSFAGTDPVFGTAVTAANPPSQPQADSLIFPFPFQEEFEETSHQLRLLSPQGNTLTWGVGLYYYDLTDDNFQRRDDVTPPDGNPAQQSRGTESIENIAVFGSIAYRFSDKFQISAEGRFQSEDVSFEGLENATSSIARFRGTNKRTDENFDPRITLEYNYSDNQLFYGLYAIGHKSGRWNISRAAGFSTDAEGLYPAEAFIYAPEEKLTNYEVGSKTTFADGRGIFNFAAFYQDIEDQQLRQNVEVVINGVSQFPNVIFTAGDSRTFGFEAEGSFLVTDNLTLQGSLGFADHEFTDDIDPFIAADAAIFEYAGGNTLKGKTSVNVPKWTGAASADYRVPMSGDREWWVRGDLLYTGSKYVTLANVAEIPDYYVVNLRAGVELGDWSISAFANNLFDDETALGSGLTSSSVCEYRRNGAGLPDYVPAQRCIYLQPQRGRELGLVATLRF